MVRAVDTVFEKWSVDSVMFVGKTLSLLPNTVPLSTKYKQVSPN